MWSGPRNLSTALMYAFAQRSDTAVWDEPFYAPYLALTGLAHPLRNSVLAAHETDARVVAQACAGPIPEGKPVCYQKHMPKHMVEGVPRDWMDKCKHVFLIRHPVRVIASYAAKDENPDANDIGFEAQAALFEDIALRTGRTPPVIDSDDIRRDPPSALAALCNALDLAFDPVMLQWPAGGRPEDGAWGDHWYGAVRRSTGFARPEGRLPALSGEMAALAEEAMPHYDRLRVHALSC